MNNGDYINSKIEIGFDPFKGIKIIAKENINKGEYIIAEKAIYCCRTHDPNNAFETSTKINTPLHLISQIEQIDILNNLIKILKKSPLDYKEFFILYNGDNLIENYNERLENLPENLLSIINIDLIEKICRYNKYTSIRNIYYPYKVSTGIWRYFSLFNHSCLPNTINFGIGDFVFVIANRLIKKGEEINILYLSTPKLYNINKNMLKNIYNFECNCLLCESEKKIREKYPDILSQYDDFIIKIREYNLDYEKGMKRIKDFSLFLDKNKNILSEFELGRGYLNLSGVCIDNQYVREFFDLANKYLKNGDIECMRINFNKYLEYCQNMKDKNLLSLDYYNKVINEFINFYESFCGLKEKDIKLLLKDNIEENKNDQLMTKNFMKSNENIKI